MRVLVDTCVLYPTVLRELVLGVAKRGYFEPLWSARILEEWRRAGAKHGHVDIVELEIADAQRSFPDACISVDKATEDRISLPDPADAHVLAAAVDGEAGELLTLNLKDFPTNSLSAHGIVRRDPDGFLLEAWHSDPVTVGTVVTEVLARAKRHGIDVANPRSVLKKSRVPRLAKALYAS